MTPSLGHFMLLPTIAKVCAHAAAPLDYWGKWGSRDVSMVTTKSSGRWLDAGTVEIKDCSRVSSVHCVRMESRVHAAHGPLNSAGGNVGALDYAVPSTSSRMYVDQTPSMAWFAPRWVPLTSPGPRRRALSVPVMSCWAYAPSSASMAVVGTR